MTEPDYHPPYILIGWGGGGQVIYDYAMGHPEQVHSLLMLDVAPVGIEWRIPAKIFNWTYEEYWFYVQEDLNSRKLMISMIDGFGVPFGIVEPFLGPE